MSNAKFFGILAIIVVAVIGGALYFTGDQAAKDDTKPANLAAVTETDHVKGAEDAKVVVIEYGDFQCPYCGAVHPVIKEVLPKYEDKVKFVFRHFPITSIHPNALVAHKAAEAAGKQDKFWEMHDKLYENQSAWSSSNDAISVFNGYAKEIGLDVKKFEKDFDSESVLKTINGAKAAGSAAGVESTPTIFVNGEKIQSPASAKAFGDSLDKALKESESKK